MFLGRPAGSFPGASPSAQSVYTHGRNHEQTGKHSLNPPASCWGSREEASGSSHPGALPGTLVLRWAWRGAGEGPSCG